MKLTIKSIIAFTLVASCYSPISSADNILTEEEDYLVRTAGKCITSYNKMADIMEDIVERDIEIMRIYSYVEVAERNITEWKNIGIVEPNNNDYKPETQKWLTSRDDHLDKIVGLLYNRNLKAGKLRNFRIELSKCRLNEMPEKIMISACSNTQIKDTPQCRMLVK